MADERKIAYFSTEFALTSEMPTYSGGLGVLAGDTVRSAADLNVPMVAVSLLHRRGYFHQTIDSSGWQAEAPAGWTVQNFGKDLRCIDEPADSSTDAASQYDKLEHVVVPLFCQERDRFISVMRHCIALNGSFFNTQRMVQQYVAKAYF